MIEQHTLHHNHLFVCMNTVFQLLTSWYLSTCTHYFTTLDLRKAVMSDRVNDCKVGAERRSQRMSGINRKCYYHTGCKIKINNMQHWDVCLKFSRLSCWFGWVRKNRALCRHIAFACGYALFALNANEEKVSGDCPQVINSQFLSPQVPAFLYNLNFSCVQTKKVQKHLFHL